MFSNNEKISERQVTRLIILDWIGKCCLLFPILIAELAGIWGIAALITAVFMAYVYAKILGCVAKRINGTFSEYVQERLGKIPAKSVAVVFLGYLFVNQVYLIRAAGRVCTLFLLPEGSEYLCGLLFLVAGWLTACGSVQKRARAAECLYPVVLFLLILMLVGASWSVEWENLSDLFLEEWQSGKTFYTIMEVFLCFTTMTVTLYQIPYLKRKRRLKQNLQKGIVITSLFQMALLLVMLGAFGKNDFRQMQWPALILMSNVDIPGGFLQRWDIVFLAVLLFSLLTVSGTGIYYMGRILQEIFPQKSRKNLQLICVLGSGILSLAAGSYEAAQSFFLKWGLGMLLPILTAFPIILAVIEMEAVCRKRKGKK